MNILLLSTHLNPGGITTYLSSLARGLQRKGNNVFVASSGGRLEEQFNSDGIRFIYIPIRTKCELSPKLIISFFKLAKELKKYKIDIIHAHTRVTQVLGILLALFSGCSYLSTCHGFFKRRFSRRIFPAWGENVIAISQAVAEHLRKDFSLDSRRISVIHNGIDCDSFSLDKDKNKEAIKRKFNIPTHGPIIGILARLSTVKGHKFFIQAMPLILKKIPKALFLIVGEGHLKDELFSQVKRQKVTESVFFIPNQDDTREVLAIMDCFVSCSLQEGLGLSIMEAQAAGVPVVAFATGGIVSLIQHKATGLLVRHKDVSGLAEAVIGLLDDAALAERIKNRARENLRREFSIESMVEETEKLYSRIR
ncbi:MAG: glycosyltransferase family 4 protein [Candidatus Omnitrophota bacterium]